MKNVKYGQCIRCGKTYPATPDLTTCTCGGVLEIVYDYDEIKKAADQGSAGGTDGADHVALSGAVAH